MSDEAFAGMVADCRARGCSLYESALRPSVIAHGRPPRGDEPGWMWTHLPYESGVRPSTERIEAWRLGLHLDAQVEDV